MDKGDIYYVSKDSLEDLNTYTILPGRPAIVVSTAAVNNVQNVVSVVFMTSKPKMQHPAHFVTHCQGVTGTALCEEITTVDKSRLGKYVGKLSDSELQKLDECLRHTFGLNGSDDTATKEELARADAIIERLYKNIESYKDIIKELLSGDKV